MGLPSDIAIANNPIHGKTSNGFANLV